MLLARACVALFVVSTVFPFVAATIPVLQNTRWVGIADGVIAFALVGVAITLVSRARAVVTAEDYGAAYRFTLAVIGVVPVLLVVFFIAGQRVDWTVLVIGLAWRAWLLVHTLPYLAAARASRPAVVISSG